MKLQYFAQESADEDDDAMSDARPGWTGNQRADGVAIRPMLNDAFEIIRPGSPAVDRCPCCGAILLTQRAAKLVADRIYPNEKAEQ